MVSLIAVVPKSKQVKIRVCFGLRSANNVIRKERDSTPTLDEPKTMLSGAKALSKHDLVQVYNLIEESSDITALATYIGILRHRHLFFCVNPASEIFQDIIRHTLCGLNDIVNIGDEIICYEFSQKEHDANLRALPQRLTEK